MDTINNEEISVSDQFNMNNIKPELIQIVQDTLKKNEEKKVILAGLKYALDNQINWQKYAEAKNLILCTVSATTLANLAKFSFPGGKSNIGLYFFMCSLYFF